MREHGERETGVGGRERLADLHRGHGVEARAPVLLGQRDAEQAELAGAAEERVVEALVAIVRRSLRLDHSMVMPLSFHLGYHGLPIPGVLPGFGHVGLGGSLGWADPDTGLAFGFVHNRLLTPFVVSDQAGFVATAGLIRLGAASARRNGYRRVREYGAPFTDVTATAV